MMFESFITKAQIIRTIPHNSTYSGVKNVFAKSLREALILNNTVVNAPRNLYDSFEDSYYGECPRNETISIPIFQRDDEVKYIFEFNFTTSSRDCVFRFSEEEYCTFLS